LEAAVGTRTTGKPVGMATALAVSRIFPPPMPITTSHLFSSRMAAIRAISFLVHSPPKSANTSSHLLSLKLLRTVCSNLFRPLGLIMIKTAPHPGSMLAKILQFLVSLDIASRCTKDFCIDFNHEAETPFALEKIFHQAPLSISTTRQIDLNPSIDLDHNLQGLLPVLVDILICLGKLLEAKDLADEGL